MIDTLGPAVLSTGLSYLDALVLGVVEGLTEFLPVSSTGHLTVVEKLLGLTIDDPAVTAFTAIIQLGAIVATFIYFWNDIARLALAWWDGVVGGTRRRGRDYRFAWAVILGSLPVAVVGLALRKVIEGPLRNLWVVAAALLLWCLVMAFAERNATQEVSEKQLTLRQVLLIGVAQCAALVPGVSRSGATISAGLLQGINRVTATRLSFFLAIPALTGAGLLELTKVDTAVVGWGPLAVGTLVSFVVAYASIAWLLRFVAGHRITAFVPYRIAVGVLVAGLLLAHVVTAT